MPPAPRFISLRQALIEAHWAALWALTFRPPLQRPREILADVRCAWAWLAPPCLRRRRRPH